MELELLSGSSPHLVRNRFRRVSPPFDVPNASLQVSEMQPTSSTRTNVRESSRFNV